MEVISFNRSLDQLEDALISLSYERNATEYRFLQLVQEFEIRQGYRAYLLNNTAEWLNLKCGISLGAGREKVRVAMALFDKPEWSAAFAEGRLSYSKARAMTRETDADETELLDYALSRTAAQVDAHCRELRNANPSASTADANRAWNARWVSCRQEPNGMVSLSANLPPETGLVVMKALELAAKSLQDAEGKTDTSDAFFARQADALVEVARSYLGGESVDKKQSDNYQVVLRVDAAALCAERDSEAPQNLRSDLPVETMRRLTCDTSIVPVVMDDEGLPIDVGRKKRVISTSLGRAVAERDEACRFPGCGNTGGLERHHVKHWADGGETTLANLLLLCPYHHRMVHEGGYTVHKTHDGRRDFRTMHNRILVDTQFDSDASRDACDEAPKREAHDCSHSLADFVRESRPTYWPSGDKGFDDLIPAFRDASRDACWKTRYANASRDARAGQHGSRTYVEASEVRFTLWCNAIRPSKVPLIAYAQAARGD